MLLNQTLAKQFLFSHPLHEIFQLYYLRMIEDLSPSSSTFLEAQEQLIHTKRFVPFFASQDTTGGWFTKGKDEVWTPMHRSTPWTLINLGYFYFNGVKIPQISRAVDYIFSTQIHPEERVFRSDHPVWGHFMQCENAMLLRSLLIMGFDLRSEVKDACLTHLTHINGQEGLCHYKKGPQSSDRFQLPCAWGLVKDLLFFNEWPINWRDNLYKTTVQAIQHFLLAHDLAHADFPRLKRLTSAKWFEFAYFRSYYADLFETVEALIQSGITSHERLELAMMVLANMCQEEISWSCGITPSWRLNFEKKGVLSPWLTIKALHIEKYLK